MNKYYLDFRERVLFADSAGDFFGACKDIEEALIQKGATSAEIAAQTAGDLAIDLCSYLTQWKLMPMVKDGILSNADISKASDTFMSIAEKFGADIQSIKDEIQSIQNSTMRKMSIMEDEGDFATLWGHDYASGATFSLRRGAHWVTNNPCKVTCFQNDFPDKYEALVRSVKKENPKASIEDLVSLVFVRLCGYSAYELRPIFKATNGNFGFVCMQTNPFNIPQDNASDMMIEQVEFYNKELCRELGVDVANVVYKLPAVTHGLRAAQVLRDRGYRLCLTLNFTVSQHERFAKILHESDNQHYVVLMGGLLDDKVNLDLQAAGLPKDEATHVSRHAAQAVIRKSYANLKEKGYGENVSIMTAAVRGEWAIQNSMAKEKPAILITTLEDKIAQFDASGSAIESNIDTPVDPAILETLKKSKVFNQAYGTVEENTFDLEDLYTFPPFMAFYDQFREAYQSITDYTKSL